MKTKVIQVDFSGGHEVYEPIGKELEGFEIGVLGQYTVSLFVFFNQINIPLSIDIFWI